MILTQKQPCKSPSRTIQEYCHYCVQSRSNSEVENCTGHTVFATGKPCPFYEYRLRKKRPSVKIMRKFCLECMGGNREAVEECSTIDCLIYPFRFGKNPSRAGKGKSRGEMERIRALRRPVIKGNSCKIERTESSL